MAQMPQNEDQYRAQRIENRAKLAELGYAPYGHAFSRTGTLKEIREGFAERPTMPPSCWISVTSSA